MRRKNLGLKVAALAVTGTIAVSPMTVRAEEGTESTAVSAPASAAAGAASSAGTTAASGTSATVPAVTGAASTSATSTTAATTGAASTPAASTTTATATAAVPAAGTTATTGTTTAATTATATPAAPVTVSEPAAAPGTTAPNRVDLNVSDDMQGTKITANGIDFDITPNDVKDKTELSAKSNEFNRTEYEHKESGDLVMKGDLSIKEEQSAGNYDSTENAAHDVEDGKTYSLKADLDVSAVSNAIRASEKVADKYARNNAKDSYVNYLQTGLRATFTMGSDLDGSFYLPSGLNDAKAHYELSAADGNPMIFRINYGKSSFAKDKVTLKMDLDLSQMTSFPNQYSGDKVGLEQLYGDKKIENFNHGFFDYRYNTSVFGNLRELVTRSAQKIQLVMKGVKLNGASGNRTENETTTTTATDTITNKTTTTEGSIQGTLVGYMKSDVGSRVFPTKTTFKWGAIQNNAGRDKVAGQDNDKVYLTVKFTDKERTVTPIAPVNPVTPNNGGNGGNGGSRTPIVNPSTPSQPGNVLGEDRPTPSNQGEVLGENRPTPATAENTVAVAKKGEVLGENRPVAKNLSTRGKVSTGDYNFAGLWASLFGLSVLSLAGYVVLSKREEEK